MQSFKKENTREQKFFIEDNRSVDVPMMSIYKKIFLAGDLYDLNAKAVLLPYKVYKLLAHSMNNQMNITMSG